MRQYTKSTTVSGYGIVARHFYLAQPYDMNQRLSRGKHPGKLAFCSALRANLQTAKPSRGSFVTERQGMARCGNK